jgi:hypothetical protein
VWQSHANTYGNSNGNSNANSWRSNTDSDGHVHANGDTDGHTYTDANGDSHSYGHGDGHFNTHSNAYASGQTFADAQAAADASPAGALIGTLKGGNSRNQFASSPPEVDRRAAIELAIPEKATRRRTLWQGVPATAEGNRTGSFR